MNILNPSHLELQKAFKLGGYLYSIEDIIDELHSTYYAGTFASGKVIITAIWNDPENSTYKEVIDEDGDLEEEFVQAYCVDNIYLRKCGNDYVAEHGGSGETFMSLEEAEKCVLKRLT